LQETIADLARRANELKGEGRLEDAVGLLEQIVRASPSSGVAEHNLAAGLGDLGRWAEAEPHLRAAFKKGVDAPETWLVLARCLQRLGRLDEAEAAYIDAIRRQLRSADAFRDLTQLRWMRSGDADATLAALDRDVAAHAGGGLGPNIVKSEALQFMGRGEEAYRLLDLLAATHPNDAGLSIRAAQAAASLLKPPEALKHAQRAASLAPTEPAVHFAMVEALLATGDAKRADVIAEGLRTALPNDQHAIALQATAWRLMGDPRYSDLYDYGAFVSRQTLDVPRGWRDLPHYLGDLARALKQAHAYREHPFNQSLRHGSQAPDLLQQAHPAIRALPQALDGPIRRRLTALGTGADPVRSRNTGSYAFRGMWSVKLYPNGYHADHVHPQGWLSSACYVETVKDSAREGWIKFGQPGVPTSPALAPEHFEKPEPGLLVLFPSYMWHGTVPFSGDQTRLSFAFDIVPA